MEKVKSENKKIGILGGSFDPAHRGHVAISKEAKKKYRLEEVIWAITKKNPFKSKTYLNLNKRIKLAKKINSKNPYIKIKFYEDKIESNRTVDLIKFLKKKNKYANLYFIMGADNLINFHKWKNYKIISSICNIIVFDRDGYKAKSLKSLGFKRYNKKGLEFVKFKKVNISSSQFRKI